MILPLHNLIQEIAEFENYVNPLSILNPVYWVK